MDNKILFFIVDKYKNVFQVFQEKFIMAEILPEYLSEWTTKKVEAENVHAIPSTTVDDYRYKSGRLSLVLSDGQTVCNLKILYIFSMINQVPLFNKLINFFLMKRLMLIK